MKKSEQEATDARYAAYRAQGGQFTEPEYSLVLHHISKVEPSIADRKNLERVSVQTLKGLAEQIAASGEVELTEGEKRAFAYLVIADIERMHRQTEVGSSEDSQQSWVQHSNDQQVIAEILRVVDDERYKQFVGEHPDPYHEIRAELSTLTPEALFNLALWGPDSLTPTVLITLLKNMSA